MKVTEKDRLKQAQINSAIYANSTLIQLYWDIGAMIAEKQSRLGWGSKIMDKVVADLKREFPDTSGFSRTNLFSMRKFYLFYTQTEIIHQLGGQLSPENLLVRMPWRHHVLFLNTCSSVNGTLFYIQKTIQKMLSKLHLAAKVEINAILWI